MLYGLQNLFIKHKKTPSTHFHVLMLIQNPFIFLSSFLPIDENVSSFFTQQWSISAVKVKEYIVERNSL